MAKPSESPTLPLTVDCETKHTSGWVASLWPVAAEAGADTHYICMKKTCNQYEVWDWSQLSNPTPLPLCLSYRDTGYLREQISMSGWGCILFTTSTVAGAEILYIHMTYEVDLLWLWSGWGVSWLRLLEKLSIYPSPRQTSIVTMVTPSCDLTR